MPTVVAAGRSTEERTINTPTRHAPCQEYLQLLQSDPAVEEAYQALFGSLQLVQSNRPAKTLLVTSARPAEGKTTVAVMLALTAALAGKRVLLIDADLRKPKLHRLLGVDSNNGLGDLLAEPVDLQAAVRVIELQPGSSGAVAGSLGLIAKGGPTPSTAIWSLGGAKLKELLARLAPQFDFVVVDSPPVLAVTDPLFIAACTDGVVLVVAAGVVSEKDTKQARHQIEQAGGTILGVVMNRFNPKLHGTGVHPYYASYSATAHAG